MSQIWRTKFQLVEVTEKGFNKHEEGDQLNAGIIGTVAHKIGPLNNGYMLQYFFMVDVGIELVRDHVIPEKDVVH
jgi:hypothetical protein